MKEMDAVRDEQRETWDRLVLLLISQPCKGWEAEFRDITRREIERLAPAGEERATSE
jgi:hypothetical protein